MCAPEAVYLLLSARFVGAVGYLSGLSFSESLQAKLVSSISSTSLTKPWTVYELGFALITTP